MDEGFDLQKLRSLRKLTRAIAESLRSELKEHLSTMTLLLRPRTILGDFVEGSVKGEVKGSDTAFRDLRSHYETVAGGRPYGLSKELSSPSRSSAPTSSSFHSSIRTSRRRDPKARPSP